MTKRELPEAYSRQRLLSLKQAAELLGISVASLLRMIKRRELGPFIRIGLRRGGLEAGPVLDLVKTRKAQAEERQAKECEARKARSEEPATRSRPDG
jgi:excisionase family DNA binding protein